MGGYIPCGMLEKQYRWESVNFQLYQYIYQKVALPELQYAAYGLMEKQKIQLRLLRDIALGRGINLVEEQLDIDFNVSFMNLIEQTYDREYQLLQEYRSYVEYFLSPCKTSLSTLRQLIQLQQGQVNTLIELKETVPKLMSDKPNQQHGEHQQSQHENPSQTKEEYWLEPGYRLEKVVNDLTYPTSMTFDDQGFIYLAEAGFAYGTEPKHGRILRVEQDGSLSEIVGGFQGPVTSVIWHQGCFYVAEGARGGTPGKGCGQITKVTPNGRKEVIVDGLPSCGDHFTGDMEIGPDGRLYFTVGTATNSAVAGTDNVPWLKKHRYFSDTPARGLMLNGTNFISENPLTDETDIAITGPYKPFGVPSFDGEVIPGQLKANGVLYCCQLDGGSLTIVADGFRNPFGLKFSPFTGKLYLTDNGADPRGNRPVQHDWDNLWEVMPQGWYGWPEFFSGLPATLPHFHVEGKPKPTFLLKKHPSLSTQPALRFKHHSASQKFDFSRNPVFGHVGEIFVAQLGDMDWGHHEENLGFKVVRANIHTGQIRDFLVNLDGEKDVKGPIRPVEARFNPDGKALYIVDFGILGSPAKKKKPEPNTGTLWRIVRK